MEGQTVGMIKPLMIIEMRGHGHGRNDMKSVFKSLFVYFSFHQQSQAEAYGKSAAAAAAPASPKPKKKTPMSVEECLEGLRPICRPENAKDVYTEKFERTLGVGAAGKVCLYRRRYRICATKSDLQKLMKTIVQQIL